MKLRRQSGIHLVGSLGRLHSANGSIIIIRRSGSVVLGTSCIISVKPGTNHLKKRIIFTKAPKRVLGTSALASTCLGKGARVTIPRRQQGKGKRFVAVGKTDKGGLQGISIAFPLNALVYIANISNDKGSSLVGQALRPVLDRRFCHSLRSPLPCGSVRKVSGISGVIGISRSPVKHSPEDGPTACANIFSSVHGLFISLPRSGIHNCGPKHFSFGISNKHYRAYGKGNCGAVRVGFLPSILIPYRRYRNGQCGQRALRIHFHKGSVTSVLSVAVGVTIRFFRGVPSVLSGIGILRSMNLNCVGLKRPSAALSNNRDRHIGLTARLTGGSANGALCILSRPAANLRFRSVQILLNILGGLISGNGAVVIVRRGLSIVGYTSCLVSVNPRNKHGNKRILFAKAPRRVMGTGAGDCATPFLGSRLGDSGG